MLVRSILSLVEVRIVKLCQIVEKFVEKFVRVCRKFSDMVKIGSISGAVGHSRGRYNQIYPLSILIVIGLVVYFTLSRSIRVKMDDTLIVVRKTQHFYNVRSSEEQANRIPGPEDEDFNLVPTITLQGPPTAAFNANNVDNVEDKGKDPTENATPTSHPANPTTTEVIAAEPKTEPPFDFFINSRRLILLAVHRINQLAAQINQDVKFLLNVTDHCATWWANPNQIIRFEILQQSSTSNQYLLEFVTQSKWETTIGFRTLARITFRKKIEFLNDTFVRLWNNTTCGDPLCSCAKAAGGLPELPQWPVNRSFIVSDYLNFSDPVSVFGIIPSNPAGICAPLTMLIFVSSAPGHFEQRATIRETYGSKNNLGDNNAKLLFLFGRVQNATLQKLIETEATTYEDIVQANFEDSYQNLTLSHLSMYAYIYFTCSESSIFTATRFNAPKFVVKADDDFFLNLEFISKVSSANPGAELMIAYCGTKPVRDVNYIDKYYTLRYMYPGDDVYPGYLSGVTYVLRPSVVIPKFLEASLTVPLIQMDDVYIGLLAKVVGIYPRNSKYFGYGRFIESQKCQLLNMANSYVLDAADMKQTWYRFNHMRKVCKNADRLKLNLLVEELSDEYKRVCRLS